MVMAVWKYELDLTGKSPNNLVSGEVHNVPLKNTRAFATNYGPFYSATVQVTVVETGTVLTQGTDYECLFLYAEATAQSGKTVTAVIHILNSSVDGDVSVDYQVVGGPYSSNAYALEDLIALLEIDNRAISWENILNKPLTFPPEPHLHPATDLYGFEYLVDAINDLTQSVLLGDVSSHDQIYLRIATIKTQVQDQIDANKKASDDADTAIRADMDAMDTRLTNQVNALSTTLNSHINNRNNPHGVTSTQTQSVPDTRTVNGKRLNADISLNAGDVGTYDAATIDAKISAGVSDAGRLQFGASQTFKERALTERLVSGVMTGWADLGSSNYWVRLRPLYYLSNGQWVLTPYT